MNLLAGRATDGKGVAEQTFAQGERAWCPSFSEDERTRARAQIVRWDNLIACL